jgi:hypothetical protein
MIPFMIAQAVLPAIVRMATGFLVSNPDRVKSFIQPLAHMLGADGIVEPLVTAAQKGNVNGLFDAAQQFFKERGPTAQAPTDRAGYTKAA